MPWMTDLFHHPALNFAGRPLHQITLPGTHDAGCYVDHYVTNLLARTQRQNIFGQLAGGIRYFDLRPKFYAPGQYWCYHGPYWGGRLDGANGILEQISQFMAGLAPTDRELLILNFSHFAGFGDPQHISFIAAINATLGAYLVTDPALQQNGAVNNVFDVSYQRLLTNGPATSSRILILYDGALDTARENYVANNLLPAGFFVLTPKYGGAGPLAGLLPQGQIWLFDQYSNRWWVNDNFGRPGLRTDQLNKLDHRAGFAYTTQAWGAAAGNWGANARGGVAGTLHLLSWTLTPQTRLDNPLHAAQTHANPQLLDFFVNPATWGGHSYDPLQNRQINILYVDDYASQSHPTAGSPWQGLALPVAIAARLNVGPVGPAATW